MKKLLAILMALVFVFSFAACGSKDKDDDKKETTTVAATEAPKTETPTNPPAPAVTNDDAKEAVDNYIYSLDTEQILTSMGKDISIYGDDEEMAIKVFDAFLCCNGYSIGNIEKINDTKFTVTVNFYVFQDYQTTCEKIYEAGNNQPEPETDEEYLEAIVNIIKTTLQNSSDLKTPHTSTLTAEYVNGKWNVTLPDDAVEALLGCAVAFFQYVANS